MDGKLLVALAMLVSTAPAVAQEADVSVRQDQGAMQSIEQTILGAHEALAQLQAPSASEDGAIGITQNGVNLSNIVQTEGNLDKVFQTLSSEQSVLNTLDYEGNSGLSNLSQSGVNVTNLAEANRINLARQAMTGDAAQRVGNLARLGGHVGNVEQTGVNLANLAIAKISLGTGEQDILEGAEQTVDNTLTLAAGVVVDDAVNQQGVNLGNIMASDKVGEVTRIFAGDQIVNNTVQLSGNSTPNIIQSGVNIANYLAANDIGSVHQISSGRQLVVNKVFGPDGEELTGPLIEQSQANIVNYFALAPAPPGSVSKEIEVSQDASFDQSSQGGNGQQTQVGNSVSIER